MEKDGDSRSSSRYLNKEDKPSQYSTFYYSADQVVKKIHPFINCLFAFSVIIAEYRSRPREVSCHIQHAWLKSISLPISQSLEQNHGASFRDDLQMKHHMQFRISHLFPNSRAYNVDLSFGVAELAGEEGEFGGFEAFHYLEVIPSANFFLLGGRKV